MKPRIKPNITTEKLLEASFRNVLRLGRFIARRTRNKALLMACDKRRHDCLYCRLDVAQSLRRYL